MIHVSVFYFPTLCLSALFAGGVVGFEVVQTLRPTTIEYSVGGDSYAPDIDGAVAKYEKARDSGKSFDTVLTVDEMINVSYYLFGQETNTWSRGVGGSFAAGLVNQGIFSTTVREGDRFFEESISASSFVKLYDRMYQSGDETTTYWGDDDNFASHPIQTYANEDYRSMMGRNVSDALIFLVSPKTLMLDETTLSGKRKTGIYKSETGYVVEAELSPIYGTINYKKQMQTISSLKYQPTFDYCHITAEMDLDLTLRRMATAEKYIAVTSAGVGSGAIGHLNTVYYHEAPPFPFPEPSAKLPDYPESL